MHGIEWLAGLLEGEGCFTTTKSGSGNFYTTPLLSLCMTDCDVVDTASALMTTLGGRRINRALRHLPSGKTAYQAQTTGLPAIKIMVAVLPYLGQRRTRDIQRLITHWTPKKYREAVAYKQALIL